MNYYKRKNIPGPDNIFRRTMNNGITLLARENPYSKTATVLVSMPCGSYLDPMDKTGLADFAASCLNTGTRTHDFQQVSEMLECAGASLSVSCGPRAYTFAGTCLAEDLPMLLELMKEIMDEPAFPETQVEIHRQRLLSAFEMRRHDPECMADERFDLLLFGKDHPYGRPELASVEEINSISREDLLSFHRRYIGPDNVIISVAGGLPVGQLSEECEKHFGSWCKSQEKIITADHFPHVPAPDHAVSEHIEIPEKSESTLILGTMAPRRSDPDYGALLLGNSILGEFGMMGRIGKAVRQQNGLAYHAGSSLTPLTYGGCWTIEAGINPANIEQAADLIMRELKRFIASPVSREELEDVKSYFLGSLPLSIESNSGMAALMQTIEGYRLGLDYLLTLPERVEKVTPEIILETARKWLDPDKLIRVTAGTTVK